MEVLQKAVLQSGRTVAYAESCTGGLVAKLLTDLPGSSSVFRGGFVTYCNEMKEALLGVKRETLEKHFAVSAQTAEEMALGALERTGAEFAVSTTGVAGPSGDESGKPLGTVYIAIAKRTPAGMEAKAAEYHFPGDRSAVREQAAREALALLAKECSRL
ncbi:MAG: CinA family protein [Clostridia bacterium]|nr:CinA family protein [Clostridia bacterium]